MKRIVCLADISLYLNKTDLNLHLFSLIRTFAHEKEIRYGRI